MITLVHYVFQEGPERIACVPNLLETEMGSTMYHLPYHRTNEYRAVTCPACKRSDVYKQVEVRERKK